MRLVFEDPELPFAYFVVLFSPILLLLLDDFELESFLLLEARLFAAGGSNGCRQLRLCQVWLGFGVELLLWELVDIRSWLRLDAMRHCLGALALFLGRALLLDCKRRVAELDLIP